MSGVILPPKMAKKFAERARNGEATSIIPSPLGAEYHSYIFEDGREKVVLFGLLEPLSGHMTRIKAQPSATPHPTNRRG